MSESVTVNLPFFPGFYCSTLDQMLDYALEREAEYMAESKGGDAGDWESRLWDAANNWDAAREAVAKDYADSFDDWANDYLDTPRGSFIFEGMTCPRFYNFETDRLFVSAPFEVLQSLFAKVDRAKLAKVLEERHTSRDGFISFYSNDIESWLEKPLSDWDCNEWGSLLCALIDQTGEGEDRFRCDIESPLYEKDYEYIEKAIEWDKVESDHG